MREHRALDIVLELQELEDWKKVLEECLEEIEESRPHDPMDPLFDRYFYCNHAVELWEIPGSAQGALWAMRMTEERIRDLQEELRRHQARQQELAKKEVMPEGQLILGGFERPAAA